MNGSRRFKPSTTARGYGYVHQMARRRLEPFVASGQAVCTRCGGAIAPGEKWHLDHSDDRRSWAGAAHAYCNSTAPHRRRPVNPAEYVDDPERHVFWGPPSMFDGRPMRWSRAWTDWRDEP